ncbi:MAG: type I methionyl aminopeptidase [Candidatus Dependentiae bacterium]|nr:type I methionyl aminopeptidase [Candidatus Dependentiae bacterium]
MITIKNKAAIHKMEEAGHLLLEIFDQIPNILKSGLNTLELDAWIEEQQKLRNLVSKMKGYRGYRHVSCISINDEVVHGVPSAQVILVDGDLVKVDVCVSWNGYCADMARSYFVGSGNVSSQAQKLVQVARQALDKGIEKARPGNRLTDISAAIQEEVERHGFGVVRDFAGHGIGRQMHEDPEILNYGKAGQGPLLQPGMAFALEPMITLGKYDVYITADGWTVKTVDKSLAAHVEDTIVITQDKPKVITRK